MLHPDEQIRSYLDGELAPFAAQALRDHLAICGHCRERLATLELLDARLRMSDRPALAPDFALRVRARVAALPPPPRHAAPWYTSLALALGLLGLLGILGAADELVVLTANLVETASEMIGGMVDMLSGAGLDAANLGWLGGNVPPALVLGLCLIGLTSVMILRQSLGSQIEA
jgi:hypothetical protein